MKRFLLFLFSVFLLMSSTALALPMAGDTVTMYSDPGYNYGMEHDGTLYNTFCLERYEYFNHGKTYTVDSVATYAENGGGSPYTETKDEVDIRSKWFYASFFDGDLGTVNQTNATKVQKAIWYIEGEITDKTYYNNFLAGLGIDDATYNFGENINEGWNIMAVNIMEGNTHKQSQLVGEFAPVPEPATLLLLGAGLFGLAGLQRKKKM